MNWSLIIANALYAAVSVNAIGYALIATGINVHFGYTGLLNFGQAGFAAIGAYAVAIPVSRYDWPFFASVPLIFAGGILFALLLGIPTLRLRADYLAIVTIAAAEIVRISLNSVRFTWLTGGNDGLQKFTGDVESLNPLSPHKYKFWAQTFSEYDLRALSLFAEQGAVAIANARLFDAERAHVVELVELDRMKSEFLGLVTHELRTPLTVVLAAAQTGKQPKPLVQTAALFEIGL